MSKYQIIENKFKHKDTYYTVQRKIVIRDVFFWWIKREYVETVRDWKLKKYSPILKFKTIEEAKEFIKHAEDYPVKTVVG